MKVFGTLGRTTHDSIERIVRAAEGMAVARSGPARSGKPLPTSRDLEKALLSLLTEAGFQYQVELLHPRTGQGFAYNYWRPDDGMALEVMGFVSARRP